MFIALLAGAFLVLRPDNNGQPPKNGPTPAPQPPTLPAPKPPLGRAELIEAAARAADAYATGQAAPAANAELAGRRFELVISFGCDGPRESDEDAFWTHDEERETLRVSVAPENWTDDETIRAMAGALSFEAAEGFWISRPWIRTGGCPSPPPASADTDGTDAESGEEPATKAERSNPEAEVVEPREGEEVAPGRRLAVVEFFAPGSRRAARRGGRPYTLTANIAPGEIDLARGLRLLVEGRVSALPDGQPVVCSGDTREGPPLCLISVSISRVAITDASGQRVLSEWAD